MESDTSTFSCPHCGRNIPVAPGHVGTVLDCPNCGRSLTVPAPARSGSGGRNPLLIPLLAVSALLIVAVGLAGVLSGSRHEGTEARVAPQAPLAPVDQAPEPPPSPAPAPPKSPEANGFEEVAGHLDRGGSFYLYLDTAQWLNGLSQQIQSYRDIALSALPNPQDAIARDTASHGFDVFADLVKRSGVEEVSGVGASSIAVEKGVYVNKLFVHRASSKTEGFLWSAFGKAPHHLDALDFLPADTALASSTDLELGDLLDGVRDQLAKSGIPNAGLILDASLAQFTAMFGMSLDDLLKSLDGSIGSVVTLNPANPVSIPVEGQTLSIPTPRLAIFLKVKDDRIFNQIDKALGADPNIIRKDDPEVRMRSIPAPIPITPWLHPTVAQWTRGYLVLATDDTIIRDMISVQNTGKGLKSLPQFASLMAGLPQEGNAFQIVTAQFGETWKVLQTEMLKGQPGASPEQTALMQKLFAGQTPTTVCTISSHLADGWLIVGKGTVGVGQMLGPLLVAPVAIAAGMALPVFGQTQAKGKATKSLSNAKQIATACKLYAIDNDGNFPPNLKVLVPDYVATNDIFVSPFKPDEPLGYTYTAGLKDTSPADSVALEDKYSVQAAHVRVVVYADTSGKVIPVPHTPTP